MGVRKGGFIGIRLFAALAVPRIVTSRVFDYDFSFFFDKLLLESIRAHSRHNLIYLFM